MPVRNKRIPLDWDEGAIEILSAIAPRDLDDARVWWEKRAPTLYAAIMDTRLLQAGIIPASEQELKEWVTREIQSLEADNIEDTRQRAWWAAGLLLFHVNGDYYNQDGRVIDWLRIRGALDTTINRSKPDVEAICNELREGGMGLGEWQQQMVGMIKASQVAAGVAAAGGMASLTPGVIAEIERNIREQLEYLNNFANGIADGMKLDGTVCRLMKMYLSAARGTYHAVEGFLLGLGGFDLELNVLGAGEAHCQGGESCIAETDKGWQARGTGTPIGSRTCLSNCLCHWRYKNSLTGEERR